MKKSVFVTNIIFALIIIIIGFSILFLVVSDYLKNIAEYATLIKEDITFTKYLKHSSFKDAAILFYMAMFEIIIGTYRLVHTLLSADYSKFTKSQKNNSFDSIMEYKSLLDTGIITQEEFEAKRKELLNL